VVSKRDLFIFCPSVKIMPIPSKMDDELSAVMKTTVAGVMGFGKSECETTIYFEKAQY
jgi:Uri superfamily endonuclease